MTDQTENEDGGQEIEKEARLLGWVPPEEWSGNKDDCISAEEFVDRGKHLMPILRQNNARLKNELLTRDREIGTLKTNLTNAQKAIERLDAHYTEANKRAVETAKAQLKDQLRQAREDNDIDAEEATREKLDELKASSAAAEAEAKKDKTQEVTTTDLDPEFVAWNQENPWYGDTTSPGNRKRTKALIRAAEDLREEGDTSTGRAFFDKCLSMLNDQNSGGEATAARGSKVEGSAGGRSGARPSGGFASLPRDAQDACHADADILVGKGKKFATMKDWEADYARIYNAQ